MIMEQQMFGIKEAAEILNVSTVWLDRKVREGKVPHIMLGGRRKITVEMINEIKEHGVK